MTPEHYSQLYNAHQTIQHIKAQAPLGISDQQRLDHAAELLEIVLTNNLPSPAYG
jgi:hypothetical protein